MKNEILKKIRKALKEGIVDDEIKLVYIMSRIRKIIEDRDNQLKNKYQILNLYCNWCLHTKITRDSGAKYIMNKIAAKSSFFDTRLTFDFISFKLLKNDFNHFFTEFNLPRNFLEDESKWELFIDNLMGVISDCSLEVSVDNSLVNSNVKKFFIHPLRKNEIETTLKLDIDFNEKNSEVRKRKWNRLSIIVNRNNEKDNKKNNS